MLPPSPSPPLLVSQLQDCVSALCWPLLLFLRRPWRQQSILPWGNTQLCWGQIYSCVIFRVLIWGWLFLQVLNEFFHNVCELDLVFNFYKASDLIWGRHWVIFALYRCMLWSTRCSLLGRSEKRVSRKCWISSNIWTHWTDPLMTTPTHYSFAFFFFNLVISPLDITDAGTHRHN